MSILFPLLILSPFVGAIQLSFDAWLLRITGFLFGAAAPFSQLRACIAWSKVPYLITLGMWAIFIGQDPQSVFLHVASDASSICIILVSAAVNFWSFGLLVQSLREVQGFSLWSAFANCVLVSLLSISIISFLMFVSRFSCIYVFNLF
jgi:hypothetical protein